jgi:hypothetical protein
MDQHHTSGGDASGSPCSHPDTPQTEHIPGVHNGICGSGGPLSGSLLITRTARIRGLAVHHANCPVFLPVPYGLHSFQCHRSLFVVFVVTATCSARVHGVCATKVRTGGGGGGRRRGRPAAYLTHNQPSSEEKEEGRGASQQQNTTVPTSSMTVSTPMRVTSKTPLFLLPVSSSASAPPPPQGCWERYGKVDAESAECFLYCPVRLFSTNVYFVRYTHI